MGSDDTSAPMAMLVEKRVADIVVRELKRTKPGVWGCIQAREVWSSEEETNMRSGQKLKKKRGIL